MPNLRKRKLSHRSEAPTTSSSGSSGTNTDANSTEPCRTTGQPNQADSKEVPLPEKLTALQLAKIEQNRQQALHIRRNKLLQESLKKSDAKSVTQPVARDTGSGFFIDEEEDQESGPVSMAPAYLPDLVMSSSDDGDCHECCRRFTISFLLSNFDLPVCDECRCPEKHRLITKTTAKETYLLKDCDFDQRDPPLKFISKKNRNHNKWGDMKLYLESQCEERGLSIWGSMEAIEEESIKRKIVNAKKKAKKYDKKIHELKMEVRSSLYTKRTASHVHDYGEEAYNPDTDEYTKHCTQCSHKLTYEKM